MKNLSSFIVRTFFCFSLLFFLKTDIQAQSADCEGPGNFVLTTPEGTSGTGTPEDPYVVCIGDSIGLSSEGVSPTLGLPNPGLVFVIYFNQPQTANPDDEPPLPDAPGSSYTGIAFSTAPNMPIINEGQGSLLTTGLDIADSISVCIVPIIAPDIDNISTFDPDCTGVEVGYDYPCITFVNPDAFPNCTLEEPGCEAEAGTLTYEESACVGQSVGGTSEGLNEDEAFASAYILTDEALNILDINGSGDFGALDAGTYVLHALNVLAEEIEGVELSSLIGQNAGDVLATLDCFDLESSDPIVVEQALEFGFNFDEGCSPVTNEPIITLTLTSTVVSTNYTMSGDLVSDFPPSFFPFDLVTPNGDSIIITATNQDGCTATISTVAPNCAPVDSCDASAGVLTFAEFYCSGDAIQLSAVGGNSDLAYTQLFILTDTLLNIVEANGDGVFEAGPGTYLGHALNVLTSEIDGLNPDDLAGLNAGDVLAGLECFDLQTSTNIVVLTPIEMVLETECFDETGVVSATFTFIGGLPEYAIDNGYPDPEGFFYTVTGFVAAELSPEDEFLTESVENQVFDLVIEDFLGCITEVSDTLPSCVKECEAEVGLFELDTLVYNTGDVVLLESDGFQEAEEYEQWYLLTNEDFIVIEANMTGEFELTETGDFQIYVYNIEGEFVDTDFLDGNVIALTFNCFDFSSTATFNVSEATGNEPIDIGPIEFVVDTTENTYVAVFEIFGGSGVYEVTSGTLETDSTTAPPTFTFISDEIECGINLLVTITDDTGASFEQEIEAPCDEVIEPIDFACEDYPIEIEVDYDCDGNTGIYTLTYAFTGGMPQYATENGSGNPDDFFYNVTGDLAGSFDATDNNHTLSYTDATPFAISIVDNFGCVADTAGTPEPCIKTAIQLIEFEGKPILEGNDISWTTGSEEFNNYFILERSYDEVNFDQIHQVNGAGNSTVVNEYQFLDETVTEQISYYRLIDVEQQGDENISDVITVVREDSNPAGLGVVGPIPDKDKVIFSATLGTIKDAEVHIVSGIGKVVDGGRPVVEGINELNISNLPAGVYFLQLTKDTRVLDTVKFIKY